jgi:hypothetical protein
MHAHDPVVAETALEVFEIHGISRVPGEQPMQVHWTVGFQVKIAREVALLQLATDDKQVMRMHCFMLKPTACVWVSGVGG